MVDKFMNQNDIPVQVSDHILEELDGQLMIFDEGSGRIVEVNQTAALIWQLCDGKRTIVQLSDQVAEAYPDSADQIRKDIPLIVQQLEELGVLRALPAKHA